MQLILQNKLNLLNISNSTFRYKYNQALVHQVIVAYLAKSRQGTRAQKNRSEVAGSSKKPWRQKGTGRARAGSAQSPIWRSGGVTFAAKTQNYNQKINKKMYKGALRSILSELIRKNIILFVDDFFITAPKTKLLITILKNLSLHEVLIINDKLDKNLILASRNIYKVEVLNVNKLNPVKLLTFKKIIFTVSAFKKAEELLA